MLSAAGAMAPRVKRMALPVKQRGASRRILKLRLDPTKEARMKETIIMLLSALAAISIAYSEAVRAGEQGNAPAVATPVSTQPAGATRHP